MLYSLGQAAIVSKGAYNASTTYAVLNTVTHLGGSYMCVAPCTGVEPGVTNGWAAYWVATTRGIRSCTISVSGSTATINVVFSDGTTYTTSYPTTAVGEGAVGTVNLANGSVTAAKLGSNVNYAAIGLAANQVRPIYVQAAVPTASSADGIYLVTG